MSAAPEESAEGGASPDSRRMDADDSGGREAPPGDEDPAEPRGGDGGRASPTSSPDGEPASGSAAGQGPTAPTCCGEARRLPRNGHVGQVLSDRWAETTAYVQARDGRSPGSRTQIHAPCGGAQLGRFRLGRRQVGAGRRGRGALRVREHHVEVAAEHPCRPRMRQVRRALRTERTTTQGSARLVSLVQLRRCEHHEPHIGATTTMHDVQSHGVLSSNEAGALMPEGDLERCVHDDLLREDAPARATRRRWRGRRR